MQAERLIDLRHQRGRNDSEPPTYPTHGHRTNLLRLRLRITLETRCHRWEEDLERIDMLIIDVTGTTVTTPRPRRVAVMFAPSLLTMIAGRRLFASEPIAGSKSTLWISPRSIRVRCRRWPCRPRPRRR